MLAAQTPLMYYPEFQQSNSRKKLKISCLNKDFMILVCFLLVSCFKNNEEINLIFLKY